MSQEAEEHIPSDSGTVPDLSDRTLSDEEFTDLVDADLVPTTVTYSTQDFDISGLVQRLKRGSMLIPNYGGADERIVTAGFQRGFVWTKAQMDRFIESLLLGYPVPAIFLVKQSVDNRLLVLDGQQRLVTLRRFYDGIHDGREFSLQYVGEDYKGLRYVDLDEVDRFKLDDSFMQATIVVSDGSSELNTAVYQIFERLNSGGTQLTPHEIRVALYAGPFTAYLQQLNSDEVWREVYGKPSVRIRDQEVILRVLALYLDSDSYSRPLKGFLNSFVERHFALDDSVRAAGSLFLKAIAALKDGPGRSSLRRAENLQVNVAQAEAVIVAVMRAIEGGVLVDDLDAAVEGLIENEAFLTVTSRSTAGVEAVQDRLEIATGTFAQ